MNHVFYLFFLNQFVNLSCLWKEPKEIWISRILDNVMLSDALDASFLDLVTFG